MADWDSKLDAEAEQDQGEQPDQAEKAIYEAEYERENRPVATDFLSGPPWPPGEGRCTGCGEIISHRHERCGECLAGDADMLRDEL